MRKILRALQDANFRAFTVWSYLWVKANEKNIVEYNYTDLAFRFRHLKISRSTLSRMLDPDTVNMGKVYVEVLEKRRNHVVLKFYDKGKQSAKPKNELEQNAWEYLQQFYQEISYDYPDMDSHRRYLKAFLNKLKESVDKRNPQANDQDYLDALQVFMKNLPDFWVKTGNITIRQLSAKYTQILGQIKNKNRNGYVTATQEAETRDFSHLVKDGE